MRILFVTMLAGVIAFAQTPGEILTKTAETYRSLKSYHFEAQVVSESVSESNESRTRSTRVAAAILPDQRRIENKGGSMAAARIFDGETVWEYRPGPNQFARQLQASYKAPMMNTLSDPVDNYKSLDKSPGATLVREESIEAGGESRTCWVVQVPSRFPAAGPILERSPTTYWIDKVAYVVLKERQSMKMKMPNMDTPHDQTTTITYAIARINEPVADALFRFDPPKGAAEVSEFTSPFGGGSTLVGKRLPEFAMKDLEGREVSSGGLEGKPALIAFWATWCAPCREQMPQIQALHRELAAKGLAVVAVNYGEAAAVARQYLEEHSYTFRALMDGDKSYAGKLSVSSIPVVVLVGSDGVVRAQYTGYNTSIVLRDEVKKIGF